MNTISSIKDPLIIEARSLNKPKNRTTTFLIENEQSISWALTHPITIKHVFVSHNHMKNPLITKLQSQNIECYSCSDGIMKKINESKYLTPFIAVATTVQKHTTTKNTFVLMMESIQDQGNLGTMIRTASALGIRQVITTETCFDIFNAKTITASRGTCFGIQHQHVNTTVEAINNLKQAGFQVMATSPRGTQLQAAIELEQKPIALIVGNETHGISEAAFKHADQVIQIPMSGAVESLNVGVAAGISMYELKLKGIMTMLTDFIRQTLGRELGVAHKLLQKNLHHLLLEHCEITGDQARLLMIMTCDQNMSREHIEKDLALHGDALNTVLQPLLDKQLINHLPTDGFVIMPEGEALLAKIWPIIERVESQALNDFTPHEIEKLKNFIGRIQTNCDSLDNT